LTVFVGDRGAAYWIDATMNQGAPQFGSAVTGQQADAYRDALNLEPADLHPDLPMQVVTTGLPYLIVPVRSGLEHAAIRHPDFEPLLATCGAKFAYVLDPDRPEGRSWDNTGG
jgi:trans-2,3-dihydro-3-hydroxyanthranilate isomerase